MFRVYSSVTTTVPGNLLSFSAMNTLETIYYLSIMAMATLIIHYIIDRFFGNIEISNTSYYWNKYYKFQYHSLIFITSSILYCILLLSTFLIAASLIELSLFALIIPVSSAVKRSTITYSLF
jgi:hypothetical protein